MWGSQGRDVYQSAQTLETLNPILGAGAMELVALDLKRSGKFIARTLSYEGVEFRRVCLADSLHPEYHMCFSN